MMRKNTRGGLATEISLALPTTWSPEQALAVVDLLNNLLERIWQHYDIALCDVMREQYDAPSDRVDGEIFTDDADDPPF